MDSAHYSEIVKWLFSKHASAGIRLGLERVQRACRALGNPEEAVRCVHVAGTNGKGSVCAKIAHGYELLGYTTGLFTSPHISSLRERLQINGRYISPEEVVEKITTIRRYSHEELTFFEITVLLAFLWFRENNVQVAILETGLGGRLDATNVCHPDLCIITSISFDHMEYLGDTLEAIAREKGGIIKKKVPVVIGPRVPFEVLYPIAQAKSAPLIQVQGTFTDYDDENSKIAREALSLLDMPPHIIDDAVRVRPVCRFQQVSEEVMRKKCRLRPPAIILDVAHNPDGVQRLVMKAKTTFPNHRLCILLAVSKDKDVEGMVDSLQESAEAIICTEADSLRAMPSSSLAELVKNRYPAVRVVEERDPKKALDLSLAISYDYRLPLIVTGTFFLMSAIRQELGFDDVVDVGDFA